VWQLVALDGKVHYQQLEHEVNHGLFHSRIRISFEEEIIV